MEKLLQKHEHVFAIHPSQYLSETIAVAREAAKEFPGRVTLHDSKEISGPMALQAERAVRLLRQGHSPNLVQEVLGAIQPHTYPFMCINNTEFLRRSRNVGGLAGSLGSMLNIRPIVSAKGGELITVATAMTQGGALNQMRLQVQKAASAVQGPRIIYWSNGYSEGIEALRQEAKAWGVTETLVLEMGVVLSAHAGPQAYGFGIEPTNVWHNFRSY